MNSLKYFLKTLGFGLGMFGFLAFGTCLVLGPETAKATIVEFASNTGIFRNPGNGMRSLEQFEQNKATVNGRTFNLMKGYTSRSAVSVLEEYAGSFESDPYAVRRGDIRDKGHVFGIKSGRAIIASAKYREDLQKTEVNLMWSDLKDEENARFFQAMDQAGGGQNFQSQFDSVFNDPTLGALRTITDDGKMPFNELAGKLPDEALANLGASQLANALANARRHPRPRRDVEGTDVPGVPRPPNSVRMSSVSLEKFNLLMAAYQTQTGAPALANYYSSEMKTAGWQTFKELEGRMVTTSTAEKSLFFIRDGMVAMVALRSLEGGETLATVSTLSGLF